MAVKLLYAELLRIRVTAVKNRCGASLDNARCLTAFDDLVTAPLPAKTQMAMLEKMVDSNLSTSSTAAAAPRAPVAASKKRKIHVADDGWSGDGNGDRDGVVCTTSADARNLLRKLERKVNGGGEGGDSEEWQRAGRHRRFGDAAVNRNAVVFYRPN